MGDVITWSARTKTVRQTSAGYAWDLGNPMVLHGKFCHNYVSFATDTFLVRCMITNYVCCQVQL